MYQRKSNLQQLFCMLLDCLAIVASLILANYIRNGVFFHSDNERMDFGLLTAASLVVFLCLNLCVNLYRQMLLRGPLHELADIVRNNMIILAGITVVLYFMKLIDAYSRLVLVYFFVIDCVLMFIIHQLLKKFMPVLYRISGNTRKLLLVGTQSTAKILVEDMIASKDYSYELVGIALLDSDQKIKDVSGLQVVADEDTIIQYCKAASLDEVLVAVDQAQDEKVRFIMENLAAMGITLHYYIPLFDLKEAHQKVLSQFGRFTTVTYANRVAPLGQLLLKRGLDILGSLVGIAVLAVLTIFVAPVIKLESPGPVFFSQKRVGRNGRIFKMYKFRSMYRDAEERKKELMAQNEMKGLMFKMEDDPRITKVGKFLRKTSLDEFPQFLNILKGDMSLVGTRPPTLDEFAQYDPSHKKRLSFRPGLTGMWQVSGRSDITDFEEIVRLDVEYIDNWSFLLDIKILLKTALQVFKGDGAK